MDHLKFDCDVSKAINSIMTFKSMLSTLLISLNAQRDGTTMITFDPKIDPLPYVKTIKERLDSLILDLEQRIMKN